MHFKEPKRSFITLLTRICHLSLSSATSIQSTPFLLAPLCFLDMFLHCPPCYMAVFQVVSFPQVTPKPCVLLCPICVTCSAHLSLVLITRILFWAEYRSSSSLTFRLLMSYIYATRIYYISSLKVNNLTLILLTWRKR